MKIKNFRKVLPCLLMAATLTACGQSNESSQSAGSSNKQAAFDLNQTIHAYTRDTTSGTRDGFMTKIGYEAAKTDDSKLKSTVQQTTGNGDMIAKIVADEYGIGYFSFASAPDAQKQGVKTLTFGGVEATEDSILDGSYKLSRNFNYCTKTEADEDSIKWTIISAFVAFMHTEEGIADIVGKDGIIKASSDVKKWEDIKANYPGIEDNHSAITIKFGGSTSCEKIAKALTADFSKRAGNFVAEHNHTGSGAAYKGTQGSDKANGMDVGFASREFEVTGAEPLAAGTYGYICTDGIVVGVNAKNPTTNITADQAKGIYSVDGTINTWADLK